MIPAPRPCAVCGLVPATRGLGFLRDPRKSPDLPPHLKSAVLAICDWPGCETTAAARALRAAAREGVENPALAIVHHFPEAERA